MSCLSFTADAPSAPTFRGPTKMFTSLLFARILPAIRRWRRYRDDRRILSGLDDRQLKDLGLSRHDFPDISRPLR